MEADQGATLVLKAAIAVLIYNGGEENHRFDTENPENNNNKKNA